MAFFRSDEMKLCQMLLHKESAFDCLGQLGNLGAVQFNNLHNPEHKPNMKYLNELQRCTEMQRMLRHLETEIDEFGIEIINYSELDDEIPQAKDVKIFEQKLETAYTELVDVEKNHEAIMAKKNQLQEKLSVIEKADSFFQGDGNAESTTLAWSDSVMEVLLHDESRSKDSQGGGGGDVKLPQDRKQQQQHHHHQAREDKMQLGFFTGSIPVERFRAFELMLWRLCRGNFFMKHSEISLSIENIKHDERLVRKYAFIVVFQGQVIRNKIARLCEGFQVSLFECPETRVDRTEARRAILKEISDMKMVLQQTDEHRRYLLVVASNDIYIWKMRVRKSLMIYSVLNRLAAVEGVRNQHYLQAECWIPAGDVKKARTALIRGAKRASKGEAGMLFPPILTEKHFSLHEAQPPTFFRLNRFTRGFQNLIDSYGIASYKEINPAPFMVITFPFLFGMMFGDFGHALIMTFFAYWMVHQEDAIERKNRFQKKRNEIFDLLFSGRYILLLMGMFSLYTGLIYNDIFSKPMNIFGSKWHIEYLDFEFGLDGAKHMELDPTDMDFYDGIPYIFGLDPIVHVQGEDAIIFLNSLKMKLAIIFGVAQMTLGLGIAAWNHVHFKNYIDLFLVFLPQLIFLLSMFGYLVALIIVKWWRYGGHQVHPRTSDCAPSILITFINMVLFKGLAPVPEGCDAYIFPGQYILQVFLVILAALCVPVLLVGKPIALVLQNRRIQKIIDKKIQAARLHKTMSFVRKSLIYKADDPDEKFHRKNQTELEELLVNLDEVWIHQGIHCIESILGAVSHTASYLRLWALSLAHDQLAHVLWTMVLAKPFVISSSFFNSIFLYVTFAIWAVLTISILVVMEGLSAFLHTLRLHWVEFQSKFYTGQGEAFLPFCFETHSN